ncbi:MAG TPA: TonB family protein [Chitinophagaceae bacterium]|nr:TonB family protein [Chitinophagaceae bacterium]
MKPDMILQSDLLDILFENRNKSYGAYVLRKEYSRDLIRSVSIVTLIAGVLVLLFFFSKENKIDIANVGRTLPTAPDPKISVIKIIDPPKLQRVKTIANPPPVIVPDEKANEKMPEVKDLIKPSISDVTIDGPDPVNENISVPTSDKEKGQGKEIVQPAPIGAEIVTTSEIEPEFPGGIEGWRRFLSKNLRAPEEGGENNKIIVIVKFVVNEDGTLTNLEITKSGGSDFDNEVMRVMKKSPKWIAGSNQGRKVKVFHAQPIIFVYEAGQ